MNEYIESLIPDESEILTKLRAYALDTRSPILRREAAQFMRVLTSLRRPGKILEAGTCIGYSAILMAECAPGAKIETVEIDPDIALIARRNIEEAGLSGRIRVIVGDATEVFSSLSGTYDMIFVDSAKGQYIHMYEDIIRLLASGGLLVCDNCIFYDKIYDEPQDAPHKHRTIVANMRAFLTKAMNDPCLSATLLEVGDGMLVAAKKGE